MRYLKIKIGMSMLKSHYRVPVVSAIGLIVDFSTGSLAAHTKFVQLLLKTKVFICSGFGLANIENNIRSHELPAVS